MSFSRLLSHFVSSFVTSILTEQSSTFIDADGRLESARSAMLHCLETTQSQDKSRHSNLHSGIVHATDAQTLWYLRSDLLRLLSECHGESLARDELDAITEMFRGIVSKSQMSGRKPIPPSA